MQGFLQIWHGFFSRWTKYYFRIHEDTLLFGPKRQQIQGKVHLKVAQIISIVDDPISFIIHTGTDTLRLRASSIEERVKWFKKLKKVQKNIQQQYYVQPDSAFGFGRGKSNQLKTLQSIVVDLWQSHAQLQNQIQDISMKFKSSPAMKNLTDKLRITVQSIKLKNYEALKIIQQYTKPQKSQKYGTPSNYYKGQSSDSHMSFNQEPDGTRFMSFQQKTHNHNNNKINKKLTKKFIQYQDFKDFQQIPIATKKSLHNMQSLNSAVSNYRLQTPKKENSFNLGTLHPIKQRLLQSNPVFLIFKKNFSNNKARSTLPQKFTPQESFPMSTVLKGSIGADLTKFALPVSINEPLSVLQKGCQQMYYSKLLDQANDINQPEKRMLYVAAFLVSQYSLSDSRTKKPFNPLLGQTFQFYDQQRQFDYISQQVSHHPPISALYCRSNSFEVFDQSLSKTSFTGSSIKVIPQGKSKIKLQNFPDEEYIYNKCSICLNGLIMGKTTLEIVGDLKIQCKFSNVSCHIKFHEKSFFKDTLNLIQGQVSNGNRKCYTIQGRWNEYFKATDTQKKIINNVWTKEHKLNKDYYYFNDYTMQLNYLNKDIFAEIAPTDCRLRPDQRALEYRNIDLADSQKLRLEQKQRAKRKQMQQKKINHVIKWFYLKRQQNGNQFYLKNDNYDEDRKYKNWTDYPDIF